MTILRDDTNDHEDEPRFRHHRPSEFRIMCPDCGEIHAHRRHDGGAKQLKEAFLQFLTWVPEFGPTEKVAKAIQKAGEESGWLDKGQDFQESAFFGAQPWSYALFDKPGGRAFTGQIDALIRASGFNVEDLRQEAYRRMDRKRREDEAAKKHEADRRAGKDEFSKKLAAEIAFLQGEAPLPERIAALDKIIEDYTRDLNPRETKVGNSLKDPFLYETLNRLNTRYKGGISDEVNRLRIEAARQTAIKGGLYSVILNGAEGGVVFKRSFQTEEAMKKFVADLNVPYDAMSEDPLATAVLLRMKERGNWEKTLFVRGKKGWVAKPEKSER